MANITLTKDIDSFLQNRFGFINPYQFFPNSTCYMSPYNNILIMKTGDTLDFSLYPETAKLLFKFLAKAPPVNTGTASYIASGLESSVEQIIGGQYLTGLSNAGTAVAFDASGNNMSDTAIDAFFTDLPTASYTATLDFQNNPGSATCDPTIATAKGYTVIT